MQLADIYAQFAQCKMWEERYRLLIKFSRQLPQLDAETLAALPEISGCESRLWFHFTLEPRQVQAYSDARLMQGLLWIITLALQEKSAQALTEFDLRALFDDLHITHHLTHTRLNGLAQIEKRVREVARQNNTGEFIQK
ncbi:hypothetical protein A4G19_06380 [Pasteurellaceae bacterium Macca]|nr:hypothetical protein [Pasteurellaceae bacterium Macca]